MEAVIGSVVISKAGRDKDKFLAVVKTDETGIYVCDGKERPLENPKRKNPIHVTVTHYSLSQSEMAANRSLRRALNSIQSPKSEVK